jgi:hypothetical protein
MDIRKIKVKDIINPEKWAIVADAYAKKHIDGISLEFCEEVDAMYYMDPDIAHNLALSKGVSVEYCRMVAMRARVCRECVSAGSCVHCGCTSPENMYSMRNECSAGKWVSHKDDEDIRNYLKTTGQ